MSWTDDALCASYTASFPRGLGGLEQFHDLARLRTALPDHLVDIVGRKQHLRGEAVADVFFEKKPSIRLGREDLHERFIVALQMVTELMQSGELLASLAGRSRHSDESSLLEIRPSDRTLPKGLVFRSQLQHDAGPAAYSFKWIFSEHNAAVGPGSFQV